MTSKPTAHLPGLPPQLTVAGRIATLTLRRPDMANRLEPDDIETLRGFIADINARRDVVVLRLAAEGRHFCAGFNIGSLGNAGAGARFEALANALEAARPVTIAMINGGVYGGATDLALACDFRIGVPASEMFVPAARLGLHFYQGGLQRYVSRLGLSVAKRLLLTAATFDAAQMLQCGFLDTIVAPAELRHEADRMSDDLASMAPLALLGMKKHLDRIARGALDETELANDIAMADASRDLREGMLAWKEKRRPVFTGE